MPGDCYLIQQWSCIVATLNQLQKTAKRFSLLWIGYLAFALISIQIANLHFDIYDHHHHSSEVEISEHQHPSVTHVCTSVCDSGHAHDSTTEVNLTPEGVVKKTSLNSLTVALMIWTIILLIHRRHITFSKHRNNDLLPTLWRSTLRPPLRAPPL